MRGALLGLRRKIMTNNIKTLLKSMIISLIAGMFGCDDQYVEAFALEYAERSRPNIPVVNESNHATISCILQDRRIAGNSSCVVRDRIHQYHLHSERIVWNPCEST